jgi:hypothetical protein
VGTFTQITTPSSSENITYDSSLGTSSTQQLTSRPPTPWP